MRPRLYFLGAVVALIPVSYLASCRTAPEALPQLKDSLNDDFGKPRDRDFKFRSGSAAQDAINGVLVPQQRKPGAQAVKGGQCAVGEALAGQLLAEAGVDGLDGYKDAARLHAWMQKHFKASAKGGAMIGKTTIQSLLSSRELSGCHDWALAKASLLACAGYETQLADTAGVDWMNAVRAGKDPGGYKGHVFVEAALGGRWVLLDSVSPRYIPGYDRSNPLITMEVGDQKSYCVMFKGKTPQDYGVDSNETLQRRMDKFARQVDPGKLAQPSYQVRALPPPNAP